jgi:hypothetical protein
MTEVLTLVFLKDHPDSQLNAMQPILRHLAPTLRSPYSSTTPKYQWPLEHHGRQLTLCTQCVHPWRLAVSPLLVQPVKRLRNHSRNTITVAGTCAEPPICWPPLGAMETRLIHT